MTPQQIGFGIIGCGNISGIHAQAVRGVARAALRAFLGRSRDRAEARGREFGVDCYVEMEAFLARRDIDAVLIGTPTGTHAELGIRVAESGKHVLVEKPIDVTVEKARTLIDACRRNGVKLGVIFQSRFLPAVQILKKAIDRGRLGRLLVADAYVKWYRTRDYYEAARWRGTYALDGGGALMNQSIHTIDLLQYLAGPVASVFGFAERRLHLYIEAEDTAVAVVRFRSGAMGVLEGTTSLYPGFSRRVEIHGERGSVILDGNDVREWRLQDSGEEEQELARLQEKDASDGAADPMKLDVAGHRRQVEDFVDAIREDRAPLIDGAEGLKAIEIVAGVYRSSREGRLVDLGA